MAWYGKRLFSTDPTALGDILHDTKIQTSVDKLACRQDLLRGKVDEIKQKALVLKQEVDTWEGNAETVKSSIDFIYFQK
jgi:FtsZ-binding cell division protein ZapB